MLRAYKTRLHPSNIQAGYFNQCAGAARFVYNWALNQWQTQYAEGGKPNMYALKKQFNAEKDNFAPWLRNLPYTLVEAEFMNLKAAYQNFFRRVKNGDARKGAPKFKKRGEKASFILRGIGVETDRVRLPRLGWVRLYERGYIPTQGIKILFATISRSGGQWWISVQADVPDNEPARCDGVLGVDVGILHLAVCSDGSTYDAPKPLFTAERKLKRIQRERSRRSKGGSNWKKSVVKEGKCHAHIANIRKDFLHEVSNTILDKHPAVIVLENLRVANMMKNHHLARALSDSAISELHRQIAYKSVWAGIEVVYADTFFPSSKLCSRCGNKKEVVSLGDRVYDCEYCDLTMDRDLNAAKNLAALVEGPNRPGLPVELGCSNASL